MGRCIQCGKEINNSFEYYSANYKVEYKDVSALSTWKHETYTNSIKHQEYFCNRHVFKQRRGYGALVMAILSTVALFFTLMFVPILEGGIVLLIFESLGILIGWGVCFSFYRAMRKRTPEYSDMVISFIKSKKRYDPDKAYLTIEKYQEIHWGELL